jgi:hypothetical protein
MYATGPRAKLGFRVTSVLVNITYIPTIIIKSNINIVNIPDHFLANKKVQVICSCQIFIDILFKAISTLYVKETKALVYH